MKMPDLYNSLLALNISVCIIWILGHQGIAFNECADKLAKRMASRALLLLPPPTYRGALSEYAALAMPRLAHISSRAA